MSEADGERLSQGSCSSSSLVASGKVQERPADDLNPVNDASHVKKKLSLQDIEFGFDFDTAEEYLLYHARTGNVEVVEELLSFKLSGEIELDVNCKGECLSK